MLRSMTGFASTHVTLIRPDGAKSQTTISLKSLNSRFFEANCRLPFALNDLEIDLSRRIKKQLLRGQIYLVAHIENPSVFKGTIKADMPTAIGYVKALSEIKTECNLSSGYSLDTLITLPNIFIVHETGLEESVKQQFITAIDQLIDQVIEAQLAEGKALQKDLFIRLSVLEEIISEIKENTRALVSKTKEKIAAAIAEMSDDNANSLEQARVQALHAFLDKIDTHEEIIRFESHLATLKTFLDSNTIEKGKRIDFTLQELMREINTIAAKCSDASITAHAINAKVELEKAREQTQNII